MDSIQIKSPAKINLGLNVIEKRSDGYHNIETIFYPVNIFDNLIFEKSDSFQFITGNELLEKDEDNLILKAKKKIEEFSNKKLNVKISLEKNIPIGAGLGGGSSNCAATLLALNNLFHLQISENDLKNIALDLGSDVPFFIDPKPSLAFCRGEKLKEIDFKINYPILIVNPRIHISTKWAYENLIPQKPQIKLEELVANKKIKVEDFKGKIFNNFEKVVFEFYPEVSEIKSQFYKSGALYSLMTGSGSTVFGIFKDINEANKAEKFFTQKYYTNIHYEKK
ncbi:MAG: 4-(cytidine 5'-diphospho)-2-C-methyl-D-erythritol kinase [Ignavibacteriaceae bacterium]